MRGRAAPPHPGIYRLPSPGGQLQLKVSITDIQGFLNFVANGPVARKIAKRTGSIPPPHLITLLEVGSVNAMAPVHIFPEMSGQSRSVTAACLQELRRRLRNISNSA